MTWLSGRTLLCISGRQRGRWTISPKSWSVPTRNCYAWTTDYQRWSCIWFFFCVWIHHTTDSSSVKRRIVWRCKSSEQIGLLGFFKPAVDLCFWMQLITISVAKLLDINGFLFKFVLNKSVACSQLLIYLSWMMRTNNSVYRPLSPYLLCSLSLSFI